MDKYYLFSTDVDWRRISWEKPIHDGEVVYYSNLPFEGNIILRQLLRLFYSWNINKKGIRVPFRRLVYKGIMRAMHIKSEDKIKIIFYDRSRASYDFAFINYLRKQIPDVKVGYLFSDVVEKSGAKIFGIVDKLNLHYDKVFSFDKFDSKKYGFDYSYLIYDRSATEKDKDPEFDVFLVAKAKDRLAGLIEIYDRCNVADLNIDFAINNIPDEQLEMIGKRKIQVNEFIQYEQVIKRLNNSKCIVDIMQKGSVGVTLNIVEAVVYNIKALSDNPELKNEPFYDPSRILILSKDSDIKAFLDEPMKPYTKEERQLFSGINLFDRL